MGGPVRICPLQIPYNVPSIPYESEDEHITHMCVMWSARICSRECDEFTYSFVDLTPNSDIYIILKCLFGIVDWFSSEKK